VLMPEDDCDPLTTKMADDADAIAKKLDLASKRVRRRRVEQCAHFAESARVRARRAERVCAARPRVQAGAQAPPRAAWSSSVVLVQHKSAGRGQRQGRALTTAGNPDFRLAYHVPCHLTLSVPLSVRASLPCPMTAASARAHEVAGLVGFD
jgi:hypothetical protein